MAALWSGQKPADMSGSTTSPSVHAEVNTQSINTKQTRSPDFKRVLNQVAAFYLLTFIVDVPLDPLSFRDTCHAVRRAGAGGVCSPLARLGMENGMLITPTRSSIGIRDLRMALMRMASPLPAWIN